MNRLHSLKIFAGLAVMALLTACTNDDNLTQGEPLPPGKYPLELTAGGLQAATTPATRGTMDNDWDGVEDVKVRVNNSGRNMKYRVEAFGDKKTALLTPDVPLENDDTPFWWQSTTEEKDVMAWTPYDYELDDKITLPTTWTEEDFAKYDIIGARRTIGFRDNKSLKFEHLLAKVTVNLKNSDYLERVEKGKVTVSLTNQYQTGTFELYGERLAVNAPIGGVNNATINTYQLPSADTDWYATYQALVVTLSSSFEGKMPRIVVNVDGTEYSYEIKQGVGSIFTGGWQYTFNITVKEEGLDVYSYVWPTWEAGGSGSGSVTVPESASKEGFPGRINVRKEEGCALPADDRKAGCTERTAASSHEKTAKQIPAREHI